MPRPANRPDGKARRVPTQFMLTKDEANWIRAYASGQGISVAEFARRLTLDVSGYYAQIETPNNG